MEILIGIALLVLIALLIKKSRNKASSEAVPAPDVNQDGASGSPGPALGGGRLEQESSQQDLR